MLQIYNSMASIVFETLNLFLIISDIELIKLTLNFDDNFFFTKVLASGFQNLASDDFTFTGHLASKPIFLSRTPDNFFDFSSYYD